MKHFILPLAVGMLMLAACNEKAPEADKRLTPTMGWSSWNTFGININDSLIRAQADAMVSSGLKDAGYEYINIDDGYFGNRDSVDGHLLIHAQKFPNGLKPVVDYIHGLGLKAGIYTDAGDNTCASIYGGDTWGQGSGVYGHEQQDMEFWFVDCGFDFIKVDYCGGQHVQEQGLVKCEQEQYAKVSEALAAAGKKVGRDDLRMNICRWAFPGTWAKNVAGSWRTTGDIWCDWRSVKGIIAENLYLSAYAAPGHYNDMDMMEVGCGLSVEEDKTHFGMWCIMNSPLLIGCNMSNIAPEALALMTNPELIALNQDPVYEQAYVVKKEGGCWLLAKDVERAGGKKRAVAIYNPTDENQTFELSFSDVDLAGTIRVRDVFEHKYLAECKDSMTVAVPLHGTRIYVLEGSERTERTKYEAETAYIPTYQEISNNEEIETGNYRQDDAWSGGYAACFIGGYKENRLSFDRVESFEGGEYELTICYICDRDRQMNISVNDVVVDTPTVNSHSWVTSDTITIPITLKKGRNTVSIANPEASAPDIDYIALKRK